MDHALYGQSDSPRPRIFAAQISVRFRMRSFMLSLLQHPVWIAARSTVGWVWNLLWLLTLLCYDSWLFTQTEFKPKFTISIGKIDGNEIFAIWKSSLYKISVGRMILRPTSMYTWSNCLAHEVADEGRAEGKSWLLVNTVFLGLCALIALLLSFLGVTVLTAWIPSYENVLQISVL